MPDEPPQPSPFPHGGPNNPQGGGNSGGGAGGGDPNIGGGGGGQPPEKFEQIQFSSRSARVPEKVARGAMATDVLVLWANNEFMLDFVQALAKPTVVARIVLQAQALEQVLNALRENYKNYVGAFGNPPAMPKPPQNERPRSLQAVYDDLNIPDDMLPGSYANGVMVRHTPAEFHVDFIATLFPQPAVSSRLYISAPRMTAVIDRLASSLAQYRKAVEARQQQFPPQSPPPRPPEAPPV
jgi:hypothetical protein